MSNWKPPRTREELNKAFRLAYSNQAYLDRIIRFTWTMKPMEWYTISRFVKPENVDFFKTCICVMIACLNFDLEFDNTYSKIRLY